MCCWIHNVKEIEKIVFTLSGMEIIMKNKIITISREFGSGGHFIGESIAKELGIAFYDKEIIAKISDNLGFSQDFISRNSELSPGKSLLSYAFTGRNISGKSIGDMVYDEQRNIILSLADKEPCVIIGRNADYILKDKENVINVFIHADIKEKTERISRIYHVDEQEALRMIKETDKRRRTNYNFYTDREWGMARNYTLSLNSSQLGYDMCKKIIMDCYL